MTSRNAPVASNRADATSPESGMLCPFNWSDT